MRSDILEALKIVTVTFIFSAIIMPLMKKIAVHVGAVDIPRKEEGHRHIHKKITPKFGALGIYLGFLFGYMSNYKNENTNNILINIVENKRTSPTTFLQISILRNKSLLPIALIAFKLAV